MKIKKLNEETLEQAVNKAEQTMGPNTEVADDASKGEMERILDNALLKSKRAKRHGTSNWLNVLFIGMAGAGKTARIRAWAEKNGVNLLVKRAVDMDETDLGGAVAPDMQNLRARRLGSSELDALDDVPNSVLFLDELNRARDSVRGSLLTLIQDHTVTDPTQPNGERYLKNYLFTIAAANPGEQNLGPMAKALGWNFNPGDVEAYNVRDLDDAEFSRFEVHYVEAEPKPTAAYLKKSLEKQMKEAEEDQDFDEVNELARKIELSQKILNHPKFSFDDFSDIKDSKENGNGLILTPRTFELCLTSSDGTKADFLKKWNLICNSERYDDIADILSNYVDKADKANSVFQQGTDSELLKNKPSAFNKLRDLGAFDKL